MREIEVKARISTGAKEFITKLEKQGIVFEPEILQEDTTYLSDTPHEDPAWNIFRIRKQGEKTILTMKYKASHYSRDNHEYETTVEDDSAVEHMLERLGYQKDVEIKKKRRMAHFDGLELCVDEIESLGVFVEIEKLVDDESEVDQITEELWNILKDLGVEESGRFAKGYDTLMRMKLGKQPNEFDWINLIEEN